MKKFLALLFACLVVVSFAQNPQRKKQGKELVYKVMKNTPEAGFFVANIDPWNILVSRSRMSFGAQTGLQAYRNNVFVSLTGDFLYLDNLADASTSDVNGFSVYQKQASRSIQANAAYFVTKVKPANLTLYLYTIGRIRYHAKIKADCNKFFGPELGFKSGFSLVTLNPDNGRIAQPVNVTEHYSGQTTELKNAFSTYMQYNWAMIGFCFGRIANIEVDFEEIGLRKERSMKKYTVSAIIPVSSSFEDIYVEKTSLTGNGTQFLYYRYEVNALPHSAFGFKFSFDNVPLSTSLNYGYDVGILPGFKGGGNFFFQVRMGLTLGKRK